MPSESVGNIRCAEVTKTRKAVSDQLQTHQRGRFYRTVPARFCMPVSALKRRAETGKSGAMAYYLSRCETR